jgi:hypothetical protein
MRLERCASDARDQIEQWAKDDMEWHALQYRALVGGHTNRYNLPGRGYGDVAGTLDHARSPSPAQDLFSP